MVIRVSRLVFRLIALLVAIGTIGGVALTWLLLSGPVSLPWLTPYVETALAGRPPVSEVEIDDTRLRLGHDHLLELSAIGVRARAPDGELLVELAEVRISLSMRALLLEGTVAPERLEAEVPRLVLTRGADGSIGFGESAPAAPADAGALDLGLLLDDFLNPPDPGLPQSYLEHIRIAGGQLVFEDRMVGRTFDASDARLTIDRVAGTLRADLGLLLEQPGQSAAVRISAAHDVANRRIGVDVDFEDLSPAGFAGYAPDLPLDGLALTLDGRVGGGFTLDGALSPISFDLRAERGRVELPELLIRALPIDQLRLRGTLAEDLESVTVEALALDTSGASVTGGGAAAWRDGQRTLHADIVARNVAARELALLWPPPFGREARAWVVENITDGLVPELHATLRFAPGDLDQRPIPENAVSGAFGLQDLTLRYFETMPPLTGVNGSATFTGQRMDFAVTSGHVGDLVLGDQGSVVITGIGIEGRYTTQLEIVAEVQGPVGQALSLIDLPPLGFAAEVGIRPEAASGHATTELRIGTPLNREMDPSEVRLQAQATITDGAIAGDPVALSGGRFTLSVDDQGADLAGEAVVEGVPLSLEIRENFADGADPARRYRVVGTPETAVLTGFDIDLPFAIEGVFGLDATVSESPGVRAVDLALDLAPTAIEVPELGWTKPAGEPGTLTASAVLPAEGPIQVTAFALDSAELSARGSLEAYTGPIRLEQLRLDPLRFRDSEALITFRSDEAVGYDIQVDGETLDLSRWLGDESEADDGQAGPPFRLGLRAERVIVDDRFLTDVDADLVQGPDGWRSAALDAGLAGGGKVELTLIPAGSGQLLRLASSDGGDLLRSLDRTSRIEGGDLLVEARVLQQRPRWAAEGAVEVSNFDLVDAPMLARLLSVASLTGIGDLLAGEGLHVDRFELPFTLQGGLLSIGKGRMYGSQVGLTFEGQVDLDDETLDMKGTVVPAYGVNWAIGQIPLIGALLKGSEGEGAFAVSYTLRGPVGEPSIIVNPLTAITPGFLRELFSGLTSGTLEPPEMLPSGEK